MLHACKDLVARMLSEGLALAAQRFKKETLGQEALLQEREQAMLAERKRLFGAHRCNTCSACSACCTHLLAG